MKLACFSFALWPFHTINLRGIMALGRSDLFLKLEVLKKSLRLIVILLALRHGVFMFMAVSAFALGPLGVIINAWPNKGLLGYTIGMQFRDVLPTTLLCLVEAVVVMATGLWSDYYAWGLEIEDSGEELLIFLVCKLSLQFLTGAIVFLGLAFLFRLKPMGEYARIGSSMLRERCPKLANLIGKRFAQ